MYQMHPTANYRDEMPAGAHMAVACAFSFKGIIFPCELKWGEMKEKEKREGKKREKKKNGKGKERKKGEKKGREEKATDFYSCSSFAAFALMVRHIFH